VAPDRNQRCANPRIFSPRPSVASDSRSATASAKPAIFRITINRIVLKIPSYKNTYQLKSTSVLAVLFVYGSSVVLLRIQNTQRTAHPLVRNSHIFGDRHRVCTAALYDNEGEIKGTAPRQGGIIKVPPVVSSGVNESGTSLSWCPTDVRRPIETVWRSLRGTFNTHQSVVI